MSPTDIAPYGMGSRGARGGTAGSSVLLLAGGTVQRKACDIAAALLGLNSGDELRLWEGQVQRMIGGAWTDAGLSLTDIARVAYTDPLRLPEGMEPGLEAHRAYDPPPLTFSNATHACEVVVDVETGAVRVERYIVAEDCGRVLNPAIVAGQQHGAVALGISGVLRECVVYDENGQNLTGSFPRLRYAGCSGYSADRVDLDAHAEPPDAERDEGHVRGRGDGGGRSGADRRGRRACAVRCGGRSPAAYRTGRAGNVGGLSESRLDPERVIGGRSAEDRISRSHAVKRRGAERGWKRRQSQRAR